MSDSEVVVSVSHVSKDFLLPHEKVNSLKGVFTNIGKKRNSGKEVQHALKDISFEIKQGEFFGIVGRNGSGKSTLLKILAGIYQPNKGSVMTRGKLVPFIELGVGFNPELSGRENVYLNGALFGFTKPEIDDMYDEIVSFAELERFMDQKLKNYSSGMQVRLAFSMAIQAKADILLIDEVLAVGDADFQRKCFEYFKDLKANKKTVVFVTHDMNAVREYCDRAIFINNSRLEFAGTPLEVSREYDTLFIDNGTNTGFKKQVERWGKGDVSLSDTKAHVDGDYIVIQAKATARSSIDGLLFGIHVVSQQGTEITALNNRMINSPDIKKLASGNKVSFTWRMLNIFNDGRYSVTLTLVDDVGITQDWIVNATNFTIKRAERSTTAVLPPLTVKVTVDGSH